MITNNPVKDEMNHQAELEHRVSMYPKCSCCGYSIAYEDKAYRVGGDWYCEGCVRVYNNDELKERFEYGE